MGKLTKSETKKAERRTGRGRVTTTPAAVTRTLAQAQGVAPASWELPLGPPLSTRVVPPIPPVIYQGGIAMPSNTQGVTSLPQAGYPLAGIPGATALKGPSIGASQYPIPPTFMGPGGIGAVEGRSKGVISADEYATLLAKNPAIASVFTALANGTFIANNPATSAAVESEISAVVGGKKAYATGEWAGSHYPTGSMYLDLPRPRSDWGGWGDEGGTSGIPGGGTWTASYNVAGAPTWWKGLTPSEVNPLSTYLMTMNAMIPELSPEDQTYVAGYLAQTDPVNFAAYKNVVIPPPPTEITPQLREQYTSSDRAKMMLDTFNKIMQATGKTATDFGAGYQWLVRLVDTINKFSGGPMNSENLQTTGQYLQMLAALDPMLAEAQTDELKPYGAMSRYLYQPFFSAGPIVPVSKTNNQYQFGVPNKGWY